LRSSLSILYFLHTFISLYILHCPLYSLSSFTSIVFTELYLRFSLASLCAVLQYHHLSRQALMLISTNTSRCHKLHYNDRFIFYAACNLKWNLQRGVGEAWTSPGAAGVTTDLLSLTAPHGWLWAGHEHEVTSFL
jgi:hypothetical protein